MAKEAFRNPIEVIHHIQPMGEGREVLDAKLAELEASQKASITATRDTAQQQPDTGPNEYVRLDISLVYPGRFQPRFGITPESIDDLAADIIQVGRLLNPITVRPDGGGKYEIIAGERRWRACTQLGWRDIPASLVTGDIQYALSLSLSENLQRRQLAEMEIGFYLKRMLDEGVAKSKRALAVKVGIDRRELYRYLAFTELPADMQSIIRKKPTAFSGTTAEIMVSLCGNGFSDRVAKAAHMIIDGKLNQAGMEKWIKQEDRNAEPDKRPIIKDGVRIGTFSFSKDALRVSLLPEHRNISRADLAALVSAAIISSSGDDASSVMDRNHGDNTAA
ncbi:ParB/RepB/Spo0J family partition protein (plasmid) [Acidithiobacillus ferriphilus]|uniref:ParB/RepB/Spo0J family partition protein n=1 Tax=Acidithiobacillus ferriphilus TaxID=1689834 RepID=UPI00390C6619